GCQCGAGPGRPLPHELGAQRTLQNGLLLPGEADGTTEGAPCRPLDVRAHGARRGMHIQHSSCVCRFHNSLLFFGSSSPTTEEQEWRDCSVMVWHASTSGIMPDNTEKEQHPLRIR